MAPTAPADNDSDHFERELQALEATRQEVLNKQAVAADELSSLLPACKSAAAEIEQTLQQASHAHLRELNRQASARATRSALGLRPVAGGRKRQLLLWVTLLLLIPALVISFVTGRNFFNVVGHALHPWQWGLSDAFVWEFASIPSVLLYAGLVNIGRKRLAARANAGVAAVIGAFGRSGAALMQFSTGLSGDREYPYKSTLAPAADGPQLDTWKIRDQYGDLRGASFAAVLMSNDASKVHSLLRLDADPVLIDIHGRHSESEWAHLRQIAAIAAPRLAAHVPLARKLGECGDAVRAARAELAAIDRRLATVRNAASDWAEVALEPSKLDQMLKLVDLFVSGRKPVPKGFLMYGPPGTGKTLIARKLAKTAGCHFEAVTIADLKAGYIGQTAPKVKDVWKRCRAHAPAILFVDECESAFARRSSSDSDSFGNELVQTFLAEWDGFEGNSQVLVIGATNRRDILDDAIVSRFTTTIEIGLPNAVARRKILRHELKQAGIAMDPPDALVNETSGMSGRDLHTLVAAIVADHPAGVNDAQVLLATVRRQRGKHATDVKELTWDDIVLPPRTLEEFVGLGKELRNAEQLAALGIPAPRGILLYGPPGTGKTQIARVLASQSGLSFIAASTSDLKANYLGQSGNKVKALFERARAQAPCILFIDEIDIVAPARDGRDDQMTQEIVGQLLQELDGVANKAGQVFLLAASNYPNRIDGALLSRLERKVEIGLPDAEGRARIIRLLLSGKPLDFDAEDMVRELAQRTEGYSGRDLQSLVTRATRAAVKRAMLEHDDASKTQLRRDDLEHALTASS
ncbi:AAA family ATPase [Thermomonas flagellata]|uniref:AAA family ATPase n=1 Tax=Thermomonas flagellata TaxID=2888524 RepID=UPI001F041481|nr:AAA family ATPase [Thermomonas flagellata]